MDRKGKDEVCKANLLDILSMERDRTREGVIKERLVSLAYRGNDFGGNIFGLIQELEKEGLVTIEKFPGSGQDLIKITRTGRVKLSSFFRNSDKKSKELFRSQRPSEHYNSIRLDNIEVFLGFLLSLGFLAALIFLIVLMQSRLLGEFLYNYILPILSFLFLVNLVFLYLASLTMMLKGLGLFVSRFYLNLGDHIGENAKLVAGIVTTVTVIIGFLITIFYFKWMGFIVTLLFSLAFLILTRFKMVKEKVQRGIQKIFPK